MFNHLEPYAGDPILSLNEAFQHDPRGHKVNLSIGIYFDDEGRIPVLDSVRQAEAQMLAEAAPKPYLPIEGYRLTFDGEKGRLEVRDYERQPWQVEDETEMYLTKSFGKREKSAVPRAEGGHGGGDDRLRDLSFRKVSVPDYMKLPDSRAGAMSCLTGIAARTRVEKKRPVKIRELMKISEGP